MRNQIVTLFVLVAASAALVGCFGDRRGGRGGGGGTDSGPVPMDAGDPPDDDGGVVVMDGGRDSGPTVRCGDGTCTAGAETCSTCESDCGPCMTSCRSYPVSPYPGVACSTTTRTCVEACTDSACLTSCLEADPSPNCFTCANQNIIACLLPAGCQEPWDCYNTCYEDSGCTSADACPACSSQAAAWDSCVSSFGSSCGSEWATCLP